MKKRDLERRHENSKVMTLSARNPNVYKFVAFINHRRDRGRGTEIAFM